MKTNPDLEPGDALLDAMLRDDDWQAANAVFKTEALRTFHAGQRVRRVRRWVGVVAALGVVLAGSMYWFERPTPPSRPLAAKPAPVHNVPTQPQPLTDQELVAAFPKGTCFIAEVDGRKQLVFVNRQLERVYVAHRAVRGN